MNAQEAFEQAACIAERFGEVSFGPGVTVGRAISTECKRRASSLQPSPTPISDVLYLVCGGCGKETMYETSKIREMVEAVIPKSSQPSPKTREELEKEWLAQTEWNDFSNWLINVKIPQLVGEAGERHKEQG